MCRLLHVCDNARGDFLLLPFFFLSLSRSKCSEIDNYRIKIVMIAIDNKDIPLFPV